MKVVTSIEEYEKNKNINPEDVKILLNWMEEQEHLPKITELEALIFLSGQHGDHDMTKKKIEMYYTSRANLSDFFKNRIPSQLNLDVTCYAPLEIPKQYDRTIFCRIVDAEPSKVILSEQVKIVGMVCDLWILQEGSAPGYQYIVDASGAQFGHIFRVDLKTFKNAIFVVQETLPINVTYIHVINVSSVVEKVFKMATPFIKSYLREKIILHTDGIESLHSYVPNEYLPKDLGGNGPTFDELHNNMKKTLLENADYFKEEEQLKRADETKRKNIHKSSKSWRGKFGL